MPPLNGYLGEPILIAEGVSAAATIGVATVTAPTGNVRNTIAVYGIRFSATGAPSALGAILLKVGSTTVMTIQYPAVYTGEPVDLPFPANHPYIAGAGAVTLTIPSFGGAIITTGQILYTIVAL